MKSPKTIGLRCLAMGFRCLTVADRYTTSRGDDSLYACTDTRTAQAFEQSGPSGKNAEAQDAAYVGRLASALKGEKRDQAWARRKEFDLWMSYADGKKLTRGNLKTVECRTSKCELLLQSNTRNSLLATVQEEFAIDRWIASQGCGYTRAAIPASLQSPRSIRIFLDCGKRPDRARSFQANEAASADQAPSPSALPKSPAR